MFPFYTSLLPYTHTHIYRCTVPLLIRCFGVKYVWCVCRNQLVICVTHREVAGYVHLTVYSVSVCDSTHRQLKLIYPTMSLRPRQYVACSGTYQADGWEEGRALGTPALINHTRVLYTHTHFNNLSTNNLRQYSAMCTCLPECRIKTTE